MHNKEENTPYCYFHPKEIFVGVCPLCLKERLHVLASKQNNHHSSSSSSSFSGRGNSNHRSTIHLPGIFGFGSVLSRLELRHRKTKLSNELDSSTSQEDSFISIKFEEDGNASWEQNTLPTVSLKNCSVIEHQKNRVALRWHKRIGHLLQIIRLKRSSSSHVAAKAEGVKLRKHGWIRALTRKRTKSNIYF